MRRPWRSGAITKVQPEPIRTAATTRAADADLPCPILVMDRQVFFAEGFLSSVSTLAVWKSC